MQPSTQAAESAPSVDSLRLGAAMPTPAQTGHRVDMPEAMRKKMETVFGADLSAVKLYESRTVQDAGAKAVTQGKNISFAPGMLDFSSRSGQALLGHELSHVVSQARGEARGRGFLNDPALEARADREGAMAASGQPVAMPTAPLSAASAAPAEAPMQAALFKKDPTPQTPRKDSFEFRSDDPDLDYKLPLNGIDTALGEKNYGEGEEAANPHEKSFRKMMKRLKGLSAAKGKRGRVGQIAYDAMVDNAYDGAITYMERYQDQLLSEEEKEEEENRKKNWFQRHFSSRSSESKDRKRQLALLGGYISSAKADRESRPDVKSTTLTSEDFRKNLGHGGINTVRLFSRGEGDRKEKGVFKQDSIEVGHNDQQAGIEDYVLQRLGLRYYDGNGKRIDNHLSNREIAFARLAGLLGSSVGLDAKRAVYIPTPQEDDDFDMEAFLKTMTDDELIKAGADPKKIKTIRKEMELPKHPPKLGSLEAEKKARFLKKWEPQFTEEGNLNMLSRNDADAKDDEKAADGANAPTEYMSGVLMEKAKGEQWLDHNWVYYGPEDDMQGSGSDPMFSPDAPETGEDVHQKDNWGQRLGKNTALKKKYYEKSALALKMDANDPDVQRQMNELFLLDTLAQHTDRHAGNFKVGRDDDGKTTVKAIDNDLTFGDLGSEEANRAAFGKRGNAQNYGGLPAKMQIDANMAKKILAMDPQTLKNTFSDLLSKGEIKALETRFEMMKEYIRSMEKEDPSLIVDQWNDETAKRELRMAGGVFSHRHENKSGPGGYSGNNYYQRMMMTLRAAELKDKELAIKFAHNAQGYEGV